MAAGEPRVLGEDVQRIVVKAIAPDDEDRGEPVSSFAERADTSTRTVYRVLSGESKFLEIGLADRLCIAAGGHLSECRLKMPNGRVVDYRDS